MPRDDAPLEVHSKALVHIADLAQRGTRSAVKLVECGAPLAHERVIPRLVERNDVVGILRKRYKHVFTQECFNFKAVTVQKCCSGKLKLERYRASYSTKQSVCDASRHM